MNKNRENQYIKKLLIKKLMNKNEKTQMKKKD